MSHCPTCTCPSVPLDQTATHSDPLLGAGAPDDLFGSAVLAVGTIPAIADQYFGSDGIVLPGQSAVGRFVDSVLEDLEP